MKIASKQLLDDSKLVESKLYRVVVQYQTMKDVRWMFAYAHYRITQQINRAVAKPVFRDPDQLLRFNGSFATAFMAAVAGQASYPWKVAFANCAAAEASYDQRRGPTKRFRDRAPPRGPRAPGIRALLAAAYPISDAYDKQSDHGRVGEKQRVWERRVGIWESQHKVDF